MFLVTHTRFTTCTSETLQQLASTELELILCCMLWRALCAAPPFTLFIIQLKFIYVRVTAEQTEFGKWQLYTVNTRHRPSKCRIARFTHRSNEI